MRRKGEGCSEENGAIACVVRPALPPTPPRLRLEPRRKVERQGRPKKQCSLPSHNTASWSANPDPAPTPTPAQPATVAATPVAPAPPRGITHFEVVGAVLVAAFVVQYVRGRAANAKLARSIGTTLAASLKSTQFAAVGQPPRAPGQPAPLLLRESTHEYALWATGRRNVPIGALFTLKLVPRQDALALAYGLFDGEPDVIEVAVPLPEGGAPIAIAAGRPRALDALIDNDSCIYGLRLKPRPPPRGAAWPAVLHVAADNDAALRDLVLAGPIARVLARTGPILRTLRVIPDGALKSPRSLSATVDVPASGDPAALAPALAVIGALLATVDAVCAYKLPADVAAAAVTAREAAAKRAEGGGGDSGDDPADARRAAKRDAERERVRRMAPAEREKYMARKDKIEKKRSMRRVMR